MAARHQDRPLRIRCMTYNLNRGRAQQKLSRLVFDEQAKSKSQLPDFCVIAFQELAGLHLTFPSLTGAAIHDRHQSMIRAFSSGLRTIKGDPEPGAEKEDDLESLTYNLLADPTHGGLGLLVYARNDTVFQHIQSVRTSVASCGFLNLMNNKGAVGVRVTIRPSDLPQKDSAGEEILTFVNAHLAAHDSGIIARNRDYQTIVNRLLFETAHGHHTIYDTSHLFFMGDLNYRISLTPLVTPNNLKPINRETLSETIQEGRHSSLFPAYDTLSHQHACRNVLVGLREAPINFKPTYKYKLNAGDQFVSFEHRLPGWTDRIFLASWLDGDQCTSADEGVKVLDYQSLPEYDGSDHKPVFAVIDLPRCLPGQSHPKLLNTRPHIEIDRLWKEKQLLGMLLDKTCGVILLVAALIGCGNIPLGFINLGLVTLFGWKWSRGYVN